MLLVGASLLFSILVGLHVIRTGRELYWLWIILLFQPLGGVVYLLGVVIPDLFRGPTARRLGQTARETLDPTREYRAAQDACEEAPTVRNQSRLAAAAAALGRYDEAERLYGQAAHGIHEDDPALLLGRANALLELDRHAEALALLERLGEDSERGRTPSAALAMGRAYEGLGRNSEADTAYQWAAQRLPGLEGLARYTAFMARTGRREEAAEAMAEIEKRAAKAKTHFRKEARAWRDLAARAIAAS